MYYELVLYSRVVRTVRIQSPDIDGGDVER
jgi:hypothetical protein